MATHAQRMQSIANRYFAESGRPATTDEIAAWAITNDLWRPHPAAIRRQCAEEIARAMREEYITDSQGRRVRAKHAARIKEGEKQQTFWADIRTATRRHMQIAFQQRRQQIVGDCRQLKWDIESFNQTRSPDRPIQMAWDFTPDLAEEEAAA